MLADLSLDFLGFERKHIFFMNVTTYFLSRGLPLRVGAPAGRLCCCRWSPASSPMTSAHLMEAVLGSSRSLVGSPSTVEVASRSSALGRGFFLQNRNIFLTRCCACEIWEPTEAPAMVRGFSYPLPVRGFLPRTYGNSLPTHSRILPR